MKVKEAKSILGITGEEDIKMAWVRAVKNHPPELDTDGFIKVQTAYAILLSGQVDEAEQVVQTVAFIDIWNLALRSYQSLHPKDRTPLKNITSWEAWRQKVRAVLACLPVEAVGLRRALMAMLWMLSEKEWKKTDKMIKRPLTN